MAKNNRTDRPLFPFSYDAVFSDVMKNPEVCRRVIGRCIGRRVAEAKSVETQKVVRAGVEERSIRCDAFFEDSLGIRYDVEMQMQRERDLPYRFRGYQSVIDVSHWKPGEKFSDLGGSYIIFLCLYDPFGMRLPVYDIERCIMGENPTVVETHAHWLALNASAWELEEDPGLRNLLRYAFEGTLPEGDGLLEDIDKEVRRLNSDPDWRSEMITLEQKRQIHDQNLVEETTKKVEADTTARDAFLFDALESEGRLSDYRRALSDEGYMRELKAEFGLIS